MKRFIYFIFIALISTSAYAQDMKRSADNLYAKERYSEAAEAYEKILKKGHSAEIYYNLGNCYYRLERIAPAVLNYERAYLLNPSDSQIRHNLDLARSKTLDKITPIGDNFLVTWWVTFTNLCCVDGWGYVGIASFILFLVMLSVYIFARNITYRKIGFFVFSISLVVSIVANLCAYQQKMRLEVRDAAVVMNTTAKVKGAPSQNSADAFVLHEGTKVLIIDDGMNAWKEIKLEDGKQGWIESANIEKI